ncbi:hypothetical protein [Streptomyces sp. st115]|uniref:hypothetical protein n=1 Tax=Streptomyces sp. st115 TaxID=1828047 RepID=UPI000BEF9E27|nr:hypothetical protein [Streptomyces sp. st115]
MTSNNVTEAEAVEPSEAVVPMSMDDRLIDELVSRAQAEGLQLTGKGQARWTMRWKSALNAFDNTFDGRLSAARQ